MTTTDRRDATDAQFADELARLNRLDVADEGVVERVARAISRHSPRTGLDAEFCSCGWRGDNHRRHQAHHVIAALKPRTRRSRRPGDEPATDPWHSS